MELPGHLRSGVPAPAVDGWFILEGVRCDGQEVANPHPCDRRCALVWHRSWLELPAGEREEP